MGQWQSIKQRIELGSMLWVDFGMKQETPERFQRKPITTGYLFYKIRSRRIAFHYRYVAKHRSRMIVMDPIVL